MGVTPVPGSLDQVWFKLESSFDMITNAASSISFAATDAIRVADGLSMVPTLEREDIEEYDGSLSLVESVDVMSGGTGTIPMKVRTYLNGSSTPTASMKPLLEAAMTADPSESAATSWTQALGSSTAPKSGMLLRANTLGTKAELFSGLWIPKFSVELSEKKAPTVTFEVGFATYSFLSGVPLATATASGTTVVVKATHRDKLRPVGLLVKFGAEDNSTNGYLCTAYDESTGTITFTPTLAGAVSDNAEIACVRPSWSPSGAAANVRGGANGGLSIAGQALKFISWNLECVTGIGPLDNESDTDRVSGLTFRGDRRMISGKCRFYQRDENGDYVHGKAWAGTKQAMIMRAGPNTSGQRILFNTLKSKLDVHEIEAAKAEAAQFEVGWKAFRSTSADDEFTVTTT